ncbi:MAG: phosphatidylserine/phosphatidylglycerophosphate/cardiolipin synthase family protein [Gemmatimonadota bacterium]
MARPSVPAAAARTGPSFARGLWRIAAANVSAGNKVQLLHNGPEAFDEMEVLIHGARESIAMECYIFRSDDVGQRFGDALISAARRGVRTRLLIDWVGGRGTTPSFIETLKANGVDVRIFSPLGWRAWFGLVPRDHRKLLVVDGTIGVTGGVGIGMEWMQGTTQSHRSQWRDTAVRIQGQAGKDMLGAFEKMWRRAANKHSKRARLIRKRPVGAHIDPATHERSLVGIVEGEPLRLRIARALQMQAIAAERSIWIASAYFMPSWSEYESLTGAARDGVDVRILVPGQNDHPWVTKVTRRYYRRLLRNGVRIWEWGGEMMHAKSSVVDGRWTRVGSTDFNAMGVAVNYELDAIVEDTEVGAEAEAMFLEDLDQSREITKRSRKLSHA